MTFSWTDQPSPLVRKKSPAPQPRHAKPKSTPRLLRKFGELVTREIWSKDDPKHRVDWQDPQVWEKIQREGRFCRADELMTSCGTVTIHQAESEEPKVLVVYNKNIGIFQLPKGRKDFNEGHLKAALRETAEETGVAVQPLRLRFGSRATPPKAAGKRGLDIEVAEDKRLGISEGLSNEVIGVSECMLN
ncbi:hypothetical protein F4780DRAFT_781064 [Xylariomycetidae sp. FL0641]|nr:hypothetical protein F4780DRAFT_781064 [Xylariomycetidae sp. FL0641]